MRRRETIAINDLGPRVRRLIKQAGQGNIHLTVEEDGKPVAAVISHESADDWEAKRQEFFQFIHEMQETANLSPEEADELTREAIESVRSSTL